MDKKLDLPVTLTEEEPEVKPALRLWVKPDFESIPLNEASAGKPTGNWDGTSSS